MDKSRTRKECRTYFENRGVLFEDAPRRVKEAFGPSAKLLDVAIYKGFSDRVRKMIDRGGEEFSRVTHKKEINNLLGPMRMDRLSKETLVSEFMKNSDVVPEDGAQAGAWMRIMSALDGLRISSESEKQNQYIDFILEFVNIDKQMLANPTEELNEYCHQHIFTWLDKEAHYDDFVISRYLLWAALAQVCYHGAVYGDDLAKIRCFTLDRENSLLLNALPSLVDGELILSSKMAIEYLKNNELKKQGVKSSYIDLATAMGCNKKTVTRIRDGEANLKSRHLRSLFNTTYPPGEKDYPVPDAIFINLWTKAQRECEMDEYEMVRSFQQYEMVMNHILVLFEEFISNGSLRAPVN